MAGEERANLEFTEILSSLKRNFEIIHVKWTEDKLFEVKFRTQIQRNNDDFNALCDEWVDLFSEQTNTTWVKKISNTGPKIRFRKQYQCWTQEGKVVKELLFDARRCRGTLDMKVLTDNPATQRKNKHIKLGLNVVVKINFTHLHKVDPTQPFAFYVHKCAPLPEPPKPNIQPNDNLSKLVADMVQKGLNASPKIINIDPPEDPLYISADSLVQSSNINTQMQEQESLLHQSQLITLDHTNQVKLSEQLEKQLSTELQLTSDMNHQLPVSLNQVNQQTLDSKMLTNELLQSQLQVQNLEQLQLGSLPLQSMESIKLELQPQLQQLTQVVVTGAPQIDILEPLIVWPPTLMYDPTQQVVSVAHSYNSHNQQGHYL